MSDSIEPIIPDFRHPDAIHSVVRRRPRDLTGLISGRQQVIRFRNGYGASIIESQSPGLELAVLRWWADDNDCFTVVYDTPLTRDVMVGLGADDCLEALCRIAALPPDARALPGADLHHPGWAEVTQS